jgi:hypothetical protein
VKKFLSGLLKVSSLNIADYCPYFFFLSFIAELFHKVYSAKPSSEEACPELGSNIFGQ